MHTGDLHLDSPFAGLSATAPDPVVATLREATITAWNRIVELALAERADFLLVAGDAFENANRTLRGQVVFRDGLARLAQAGVPSFVVTGNHDHDAGRTPAVDWPAAAHRFGTDRPEGVPVLRDGTELARVYGIGYPVREVKDNLAARFRREEGVPYAIGLLHANVGRNPSAGDYAPCTMEDLRRSGMDYWALGHIHKHGVLSETSPTVVYCGNPQGRDPGEPDPRGCYLVTVDGGGRTTTAFREVDVVRWQLLEVSIDGLGDAADALVDRVTAAVDAARTAAGRSIVARVTLVGRGPVHAELARATGPRDVLDLVRARLGVGDPFAWLESVRDATRPDVDVAARTAATDVLGGTLRRFAAALEGGPAADEAAAALAALYGAPVTGKRLAAPRGDELARLLDEARTLVLDHLGDEPADG